MPPTRIALGASSKRHSMSQPAEAPLEAVERCLQSRFIQRVLAVNGVHLAVWRGSDGLRMHHTTSLLETLGYPEDHESRTLNDYDSAIHPEDLEPARSLFQRAPEMEQIGDLRAEVRFRDVSGRWRWFEIGCGGLDRTDTGGWSYLITYCRETTRERSAERAEPLNDDLLKTLANESPIGLYIFDSEDRCIYVNGRSLELFGLSHDEALDDGWRRVVHPEDRRRVVEAWDEAVENDGEFVCEFRLLRRDGTIRWVRSRSAPSYDALADGARRVGTLEEITDLREAAIERDAFFALTSEVFVVSSLTGLILDISPGAEQFLGYPRDELLGRNGFELLHSDNHSTTVQALRGLFTGQPILGTPIRLIRKDGALVRCIWSAQMRGGHVYSVVREAPDQPQHPMIAVDAQRKRELEAYAADVTRQRDALRTANSELEVLAATDSLTGLWNHGAFQERLDMEFREAQRSGRLLALLLVDLDHFKRYNDTHLHQAGDAALEQVAQCLRGSTRAQDHVSRYGGEEFGVILPDTDLSTALQIGERIRQTLEAFQGFRSPITTSVGASVLTAGMRLRTELISAADRALYDAKRRGRNRVCGSNRE